jgi:hypothetical protein
MASFRTPTFFLLAAAILPATGCATREKVLRPDLLPPDEGVAQANSITHAFCGREVDVEIVPGTAETEKPRGAGTLTEAHLPPRLSEEAREMERPIRNGTLAPLDGKSYLLYETPEEAIRIPFERTGSISTNDRGRGALYGMLVGAIPGALAGVLLGFYAGGMSCVGEDENGMSRQCHFADYAKPIAGFGVLGALLTGGAGAGIGAAIGHRTTFTF